jgi:hypothetical protein
VLPREATRRVQLSSVLEQTKDMLPEEKQSQQLALKDP